MGTGGLFTYIQPFIHSKRGKNILLRFNIAVLPNTPSSEAVSVLNIGTDKSDALHVFF